MSAATTSYNCVEQVAQRVWAATTIEEKRQLMVDVIDSLKFKAKQDRFRRDVAAAKNTFALDKLAGDLALIQSGDRVIA